jgi:RNA polymerase sigma-70 factor (ECF subfamily)
MAVGQQSIVTTTVKQSRSESIDRLSHLCRRGVKPTEHISKKRRTELGTSGLQHRTEQRVIAEADAVLVARAQLDRHAFAPLYDRYFDPIFRFCFYRVGNWQEAEDAAGDVFARALAELTRFRDDGREDCFRCWLFTIARNVVANRHRHRARHPQNPLTAAFVVPDPGPGPEDAALAADDHRLVLELLARLTPNQCDLLELRLAGLNDAQIARILNRSHDAIRKEQSRTIKALRLLVSGPGQAVSSD